MPRLIVNADDLGYTGGVDRAVAALHGNGALSSATAMAAGASLPASTASLPQTLDLGCHVVLVDGSPSSRPETLPTLTHNGAFRPSLGRFAAAVLRGQVEDREIEQEAVAQIRSLQSRSFCLSHLDTHKHTHILPKVLRPLLRAALQCGIRSVRNPFEPAWSRRTTSGVPLLRRCEFAALSSLRGNFLRAVDRAGLRTTDGALGVLATGVLNATRLERLLEALAQHGEPNSCYELVCHPGFHDADLDRQRTRLRAEREQEYTALLEVVPRWTGAGAPHRLCSFADL